MQVINNKHPKHLFKRLKLFVKNLFEKDQLRFFDYIDIDFEYNLFFYGNKIGKKIKNEILSKLNNFYYNKFKEKITLEYLAEKEKIFE